MYDKLRQEFQGELFRLNMKSELGNKCVNCGSTENIEYHHIVPLKNGGTNNLSNIVPLCETCHYKAHDRKSFRSRSGGGRPKIIKYEDAEPILKRYFNEEIGTKETKKLLGISPKNKSTWSALTKQYKENNKVDEHFYNHVDILNAQMKRLQISE